MAQEKDLVWDRRLDLGRVLGYDLGRVLGYDLEWDLEWEPLWDLEWGLELGQVMVLESIQELVLG